MAASQYYSVTARVGVPSRHEVEVTIPLVGPAGPQGPAGEGGGGDVESVNGQTGVVVLAAADVGAVASNDARLTDARTPTSHTHGNLTNAGAIGTTANLPVKTGTSGVLEAGAFGTSAGQFAEGNHTHAASAITSGTLDIARIPTGTGSTQVAVGNHTHTLSAITNAGTAAAQDANQDLGTGDEVTFEKLNVVGPLVDDTFPGNGAIVANTLELASYTVAGPLDVAGSIVFASVDSYEMKLSPAAAAIGANINIALPNASGTLALLETLPAGGSTNLWIPASAWIPRTTGGCGVDSREIGSTNRQNFDELLFDAGTDEFAQALVIMPSNYNNSTITARFYWTAASGSGDVIWGIQGRAFANDDALDTAHGTAQTATDTLLAADDMHVSAATSAVTIGGTPAANTPIQFQVYRDADAGGDTLAVDARLLGVEILFN